LYTAAVTRYGNNKNGSESFATLLSRVKTGSRQYRKILGGTAKFEVPHNLVKFADNTDAIIGSEPGKKMQTLWNNRYLSNACRTFYFKLINNILPYNHVLSHFVPGKSRNCTFCDVAGNQEEDDETPLHLFYSCEVSERVLNDFYTNIVGVQISRQEFFTLPERVSNHDNTVLTIVHILVKKNFWDCKLTERIPSVADLKNYVVSEFEIIQKICPEFKNSLKQCNLNINFKRECGLTAEQG
jgi:hypothetical protein